MVLTFRKVTVNSDFLILFSFGLLDLCNNKKKKKKNFVV